MSLNNEQTEVVYSNSSRILCLAGAGTGKTHCMISRISRLVDEGIDPSSMLVLTFTNAAAFEMKERYCRSHSKPPFPDFRTFHSFCYYLLSSNKSLRMKLGYSSVPIIAEPEDVKRMLKEAELQLGIHLSEKKLSGKYALTAKEKFEYETLKKAHARIMKAKNFITFDKLCYDVCKLFVEDDPDVSYYKSKYKYIFVDEFQDTDPKQYDFVKSFSSSNLFVVGDALQAIYSFRGADSSIIKDLAESSEWTTYKLFRNYRSTKAICDYANGITNYARDSYRIMISSEVDGPDVDIHLSRYGFSSRNSILDKKVIEEIIRCKENKGTTAILCRTNREVADVQGILSDNSIPYTSGKKDTDSINILKSVSDNIFAMEWLATFLNSESYSEYIRQSTADPDSYEEYGLADFLSNFGKFSAVDERWRKIACIRNVCKEKYPNAITKVADIMSVLGLDIIVDETVNSLNTLVKFLEDALGQSGSSNEIYVGTIHSVKGLEYDNVLVLGVGGASFPLTNEENNNIYYVAVTRAKTNLEIIKGM